MQVSLGTDGCSNFWLWSRRTSETNWRRRKKSVRAVWVNCSGSLFHLDLRLPSWGKWWKSFGIMAGWCYGLTGALVRLPHQKSHTSALVPAREQAKSFAMPPRKWHYTLSVSLISYLCPKTPFVLQWKWFAKLLGPLMLTSFVVKPRNNAAMLTKIVEYFGPILSKLFSAAPSHGSWLGGQACCDLWLGAVA